MLFLPAIFLIFLKIIMIECSCIPTSKQQPWMRIGDVWYTKLDAHLSWFDSMVACQKLEGGRSSLATVRNTSEQNAIQNHFSGYFWLGGFEIESTGLWFWWTLGKPEKIGTVYWNKGEPNNSKGNGEACLVANWGVEKGWNDGVCTSTLSALCELRCNST